MRKVYPGLDLGLASSIVRQFTDDRVGDTVLPAIVGGRARGNRVDYASIGPVAAYDFGQFAILVTYQQAVRARNTSAGSQIWTRINIPIYTAKPPSPPALESVSR